jgi:WD40 repeat protein
MKGGILLRLAFFGAVALSPPAVFAADTGSEKAEYEAWIASHGHKEMTATQLDGKNHPLRLMLFGVKNEGTESEFMERREVTAGGDLLGFSGTLHFGNLAGGGKKLPADTLARLDELLATLPDDGGRLPPLNRRVLIQYSVGGKMVTRVYDRGNLPDAALEIFRLSNYDLEVYLPRIKPQSEIDARGYEPDGFLCLAPDHRQLLFTGMNQPLQVWDLTSHELVREIRGLGSRDIALSPDGSEAVIGDSGGSDVLDMHTWEHRRVRELAGKAQYLPGERPVLVLAYRRELKFYDSRNWQPVDRLPEIPPDAVQYVPAAKSGRAVVAFKDGTLALWDAKEQRTVARLEAHAVLNQAAFSVDESLVAVAARVTEPKVREGQIDIWETVTGRKVQSLRPFEKGIDASVPVTGLIWSPDGEYLLAGTVAVRPYGETAVSVFNLKTGRHRGQFICAHRINGIVLLPDASQLVVGCTAGKIQFWDFPAAMKQIKAFEESLGPTP